MTVDLRPWKRLLAVWLPAVMACVATVALYVWQTSESGGRRAQVRSQINDLESEIARLDGLLAATTTDRDRVAELERQFSHLYADVFGDLDDRLTDILRAVGSATRNAGLLPESFAYSANEERGTGFIRFGVQFSNPLQCYRAKFFMNNARPWPKNHFSSCLLLHIAPKVLVRSPYDFLSTLCKMTYYRQGNTRSHDPV